MLTKVSKELATKGSVVIVGAFGRFEYLNMASH